MSSGSTSHPSSAFAVAAAFASVGSLPLLGFVFTGFLLGGLFSFVQALALLACTAVAAMVLGSRWRSVTPAARRGLPTVLRGPGATALVALWGLTNVGLYLALLGALCGDPGVILLFACAALGGAAGLRHRRAAMVAAGFALVAFGPLCLGLVATCAGASTWSQLLHASAPAVPAWYAPAGLAWLVLSAVASERYEFDLCAARQVPEQRRTRLATHLLLKLPAGLLGLLVGTAYYGVHGARTGFVEALCWAIQGGEFLAPWFVVMVLSAGFMALVPGLQGLLSGAGARRLRMDGRLGQRPGDHARSEYQVFSTFHDLSTGE